MPTFDVRLFSIKAGAANQPRERDPMTVDARSIDAARRHLAAALEREGHRVRGVNVGPGPTGKPILIAYIWEPDQR